MAKAKQNKKKMSKPALIAAIIAIVILVALAVSLIVGTGIFFRVQKGASSDNFEVNASMMEYYANSYMQNWYQQNYYYVLLGYINFNPNLPLNEQYTDSSKTQTYYDFFVNGAKTTVTTYLKYCEAAKADKTVDFAKLEDEAKQYAKDSIFMLKESAKEASKTQYQQNGSSISFADYIRQNFGEHVNKNDLKKALIIEHIASSYYEIVHDRINAEVDDKREDKFFEDNLSSFVSAEYLIYTLSSTKTVTFPKAEDYVGGAESAAYKKAIEGKTPQQIADAKIDPADYEGGEEAKAYQDAKLKAEENKKSNEESLKKDKEIIEKLANCTTAEEFKRILLEEKYNTNFESAYNTAIKGFGDSDKPSKEALEAYKTEELKKAIIDAVLNGDADVDAELIKIAEGASEKWTTAAKALPKTVITNLKKVITDATKTTSYTLTSALGNKLFGGVKAEYGIEYEGAEVEGTNAKVNDCWSWDILEINVENAKYAKKIAEAAIVELADEIAKETDEDKKKALEDEKKALEDSLTKLDESITKAEEKLANVETTSEYSLSAYFVTEAAHRDDHKLRNVSHILFKVDATKDTNAAVSYKTSEEAKAAAEALLEQIKAETNLTKEKFEEFGKVTHDSNVSYDDVDKGQMVEEFEDWLFAATTEGELGLVETQYGWHIMYYGGEGEDIAWRITANEGATNEDVGEWFEDLPEYGISINDEIFSKIFGIDESHEGHNH